MKKIIGLFSIIAFIASQDCIAQKKGATNKETVLLSAKIPQAGYYEWGINTEQHTYTGTDPSLENAKKIMALVAGKEVVMGRIIIWVQRKPSRKK